MLDTNQTAKLTIGSVTYYGEALPGTAIDAEAWRVYAVETSTAMGGTLETKMLPIGKGKKPSNNFEFKFSEVATDIKFSFVRDLVAPTITSLPNWGTGADSGQTIAKTVTFNDAFGQDPGTTSITASNGASITGFTPNVYGSAQAFNLVAPVNLSEWPITVVVTYSVTDAAGNTTTTTQNVTVAPAFVDFIDPINLTGVNISSPISETVTIANEPVKVTVGNSDIGGAVIATTSVFSTDISVTGTSSATPDSYSGTITIQNEQGAVAEIIIGLLVSEPI